MKRYFQKLLEDRIRFLDNEVYQKKHLLTMNLSVEEKDKINETLLKHKQELYQAKQFYFQLDEIELYAEHSSI